MSIQTAAFVVGIVLGSAAIICACYVWVRQRLFALGGSVLTVAGIALIGLSLWSSIQIDITKEGIKAQFDTLKHQLGEVAQAAQEVSEEAHKTAEAAESSREQVVVITRALETTHSLPPDQMNRIRQLNQAQPRPDLARLSNATKRLGAVQAAVRQAPR